MPFITDPRSLELKEEYESLKEDSERAAETSTFNYHKQRGIKAEIKQYEEQKSEAERYERTLEERVFTIANFVDNRIKRL
jgi:structural maintenance of chromosome 1